MEIEVEVKVSTASRSSSIMALLKSFEKEILCFIFGPPELDEEALDKIKKIIEKASIHKL